MTDNAGTAASTVSRKEDKVVEKAPAEEKAPSPAKAEAPAEAPTEVAETEEATEA
jgi:hypothetical protein